MEKRRVFPGKTVFSRIETPGFAGQNQHFLPIFAPVWPHHPSPRVPSPSPVGRRATGGGRLSRSGAEGGSALGEIGVQHENKTVQNSATLWKIVEMSTCNLILKFEEML